MRRAVWRHLHHAAGGTYPWVFVWSPPLLKALFTAQPEDILSLLLQTRYDDGSPLGDQQIRDELVVMLMAGHETTGTALSWAFERILSLPGVERRIREELSTVAGDGPLTAAHLPQLKYLDAAVKESLRIRPIMPVGGGRLVKRAFEIGGHLIPPGAILVNAMSLLHRRPDLYPEPDEFNPSDSSSSASSIRTNGPRSAAASAAASATSLRCSR